MELAVCVSGFLLLLFSTAVHLSPHPKQKFGLEGRNVAFDPDFFRVDDFVLYRVLGDGDLLLLINCSQPERPQPDGYEVKCVGKSHRTRFEMSNLTISQSGDYRAEGWRGGNIRKRASFHLTVCAESSHSSKRVSFGRSVKLCSLNSTLPHVSSLQLYRSWGGSDDFRLVLDTNSSLEPLAEDLKGRLQLDLNSSVLTLSAVMERNSIFSCTVWREAQCQRLHLSVVSTAPKRVFTHEGENVTLSCIAESTNALKYRKMVHWTTPTWFFHLGNHTSPAGMYMLNGSQTGDYSLIIPSVSLQHSGEYVCGGVDLKKTTVLYVCTKLSPLEVMFSPGQSVLLDITEHLNNYLMDGTQWYRQRVLQPQVLIVDLDYHYEKAPVSLPEDLRGRVTVSASPSNSSLIISNLTAEDGGMYTWRVYLRNMSAHACYEGSIRLVDLDPLGAQSEDEDLHDDVEMSELNTPPSAVSDEAVEHSF